MNIYFFLLFIIAIQLTAALMRHLSSRAAEDARRRYRPPVHAPVQPSQEAIPKQTKRIQKDIRHEARPLGRAEPEELGKVKAEPRAPEPTDAGTVSEDPREFGEVAWNHVLSPQAVVQGIVMSEVLGRPKSVFAPRPVRILRR